MASHQEGQDEKATQDRWERLRSSAGCALLVLGGMVVIGLLGAGLAAVGLVEDWLFSPPRVWVTLSIVPAALAFIVCGTVVAAVGGSLWLSLRHWHLRMGAERADAKARLYSALGSFCLVSCGIGVSVSYLLSMLFVGWAIYDETSLEKGLLEYLALPTTWALAGMLAAAFGASRLLSYLADRESDKHQRLTSAEEESVSQA